MRHVGMDPEHGLLRWGNYNWILLLSSKVFEADDTGRSYRFRPNVAIDLAAGNWRPDGHAGVLPGAGRIRAWPRQSAGRRPIRIESSRQTTNSWGLRGPEPEPDAPMRGIVLGDSYMQGMFIGDDETPPECLRRYLQREPEDSGSRS